MSNKNHHSSPEARAAWRAAQRAPLMCRVYTVPADGIAFTSNKPLSKEKRRRLEVAFNKLTRAQQEHILLSK